MTDDIADLERKRALSRPPADCRLVATHESRAQLAQLQEQARTVFEANGKVMPPPDATDNMDMYRLRLVRSLQDKGLSRATRAELPDWVAREPATLDKIETALAQEAMVSAHASPVLNPVLIKDSAGRKGLEFFGKKSAWMSQFKALPQLMTEINGEPVDFI